MPHRHRHSRPGQPEKKPASLASVAEDAAPRRIALLAGGLAAFVFVVVGIAIFVSLPKKLTERDRAMLRDYDTIRAALVGDDLTAACNLALGFSRTYSANAEIAQSASDLAQSHSLEGARLAFSSMSKTAVTMARKHNEYFIVGCDMQTNQCPAKCAPCLTLNYGKWLQLSPEFGNPFMGSSSPKCGVVALNR